MRVLFKYTRNALKKSKTRTLVTIIGIILSMALFTAVIEGAFSGLIFYRNSIVEEYGKFQGFYSDINKKDKKEIIKSDEIESYASWEEVGWAKIDSSIEEDKPYIHIESMGKNFNDLVKVDLLEGRMPKDSSEIIISDSLVSNLDSKSIADFKVGKTIDLSIGQRLLNGNAPKMNDNFDADEELVDTKEKSLKIVGVFSRLSYDIEYFECPGYTALTLGEGNGNYGVFFTLKSPDKFVEMTEKIGYIDNLRSNGELLRTYGNLGDGNIKKMLFGFTSFLVVFIVVGSVSLIYNSFSISLSERTKQYGILKSIGATKKQIVISVFYEAFVLALIAIPIGMIVGCVGIGTTFYLLKDAFKSLLSRNNNTEIYLVLNFSALIIAALVCLFTTMISALIPALRTIKKSAIESIRQVDDIKVSAKKVKTSKITQKIFGFEGMMGAKNFKRNKKRYRTTVISLCISVVIFITASTFSAYVSSSLNEFNVMEGTADIRYGFDNELFESIESERKVFDLLKNAKDVTGSAFVIELSNQGISFETEYATDEYLKYFSEERAKSVKSYSQIIFLDDDYFKEICKNNNLNYKDYFDKTNPKAIMHNHETTIYQTDNGTKFIQYEILDKNKLPLVVNPFVENEYDENGDIKEESFELKHNVNINGFADDCGFIIGDVACVIYPSTMFDTMVGKGMEDNFYTTCVFTSENHVSSYDDMTNILTENSYNTNTLNDLAQNGESNKLIIFILDVFAYGFIVLISLIVTANVFNTISTNVLLRRREFAMMKSVGMTEKGVRHMLYYESFIYGFRSIITGVPIAILLSYYIYKISNFAGDIPFFIPVESILIAVISVFVVVFATMLFSSGKLKKDNTIEALRSE
ncbi:putative ABC transport system permease protein [Acetitomaculum ruminis DSM 5522]|uniref:Putative ABC transport system permease protein n=1 Tax=Acetitomaculum ruminis DSM 5522 TaxID=1120918 RepID=A0A1I0X9J3_9FIRM|nr:ABC transporter permease [Acetitomaculum ruminis]SFA97544.1 putative ABC transport system permease protein [Acetitomaculum ruminis DSM 5522]